MKSYHSKSDSYFNKSIDFLINNYSDSFVNTQNEFIEILIKYIHDLKKEGFDLDTVEKHILSIPDSFTKSIMIPNINEFYLDRIIKLISKDRNLLNLHVKSFLDKKISLEDLNNSIGGDYNENIGYSMQLAVKNYVILLFSDKYCISKDLMDLKKQYINGDLDASYSAKLSSYIYDLNNSHMKNYYSLFLNKLKKDFSPLVNTILKNYPNLLTVITDQDEFTSSSDSNLDSIVNHNSSDSLIKCNVEINSLSCKPFYSDDFNNNLNIFIYDEFLKTLTNSENFYFFHDIFSKQDNRAKKHLNNLFFEVFNNHKIPTERNFKQSLCYRIIHITDFLNEFGLLQHYNKTNNSRLDRIGIPELKYSYDELYSDLTDFNTLYNYSLESLLGLSAFYCNRASKTAKEFCKSIYILNKMNVLDTIYNNNNFSIADLNLSEDSLKEMMAQFDLINEDFQSYFSKKSNLNNYNGYLNVDFSDERHASDYYKLYTLNHDAYENRFSGQYDSDFDYMTSHFCNLHNFLYCIKTQSIQSLVYTALKDNKKNIINWGFIDEKDANRNPNMILLGFDIQSLNMPIKFHIHKKALINIVKEVTGGTSIPYYIGENDLKGTQAGDLTTQIVDVVSKDKKKAILKNNRQSFFFNHIKWLQKTTEKPNFLKDVPERFYDLKDSEIDKNK